MVVVVIAHYPGGQHVEVAFCRVLVVEELLPGLCVRVELVVSDHLFAFWVRNNRCVFVREPVVGGTAAAPLGCSFGDERRSSCRFRERTLRQQVEGAQRRLGYEIRWRTSTVAVEPAAAFGLVAGDVAVDAKVR